MMKNQLVNYLKVARLTKAKVQLKAKTPVLTTFVETYQAVENGEVDKVIGRLRRN
jgi:hypothetical protein